MSHSPSTPAQVKRRVRKALRSIYGSWHGCALGTRKNPLHVEDQARGLKKGDLCDDCNYSVAAYMKDIFK